MASFDQCVLPIGLRKPLSPILVSGDVFINYVKSPGIISCIKTLWDAEHEANSSSTTWPGGKMSAFLFGFSLVPVVAAVGWAKF